MSVQFDTSKADGQHRKFMSSGFLAQRLTNFVFIPLEEGIRLTVKDYKVNREQYRHGS